MSRSIFLSTGSLLAASTLAVGCGTDSGDGSESVAPKTTTTTAASTTTAQPKVADVDPVTFAMNGRYVFNVRPGDGDNRLCVLGDGSVTCTGTPPSDAPDVTVPPFDTQRPGAVSLGKDGLSWTVLEGVPPAPGELGRNQRIADGGVECVTDDNIDLSCDVGENGFTVSGRGADIQLRGTLRVTETPDATTEPTSSTPAPEEAGIDGPYVASDEPVEPGTWCGVETDDRTSLVVDSGRVSCLDAESVVNEYLARREGEGGGNTLFVTVGDWGCTTPTAGESRALGEEVFHGATDAGVVCERPDGAARVVAPIHH
jgi:hypothetical protein